MSKINENLYNLESVYKEVDSLFNEAIKAEFLLKTIVEATDDAILYVNESGYIELLSKPYADFLGINKEDVIGKHVTEVIENTRMDIVIKTGIAEIAEVHEIKGKKMIATRISLCKR